MSSSRLSSNRPAPSSSDGSASSQPANSAASDPLDAAALKLAEQAAFLQGFAEKLAEAAEERPVEDVLPERSGGEIDFGWRAGLQW